MSRTIITNSGTDFFTNVNSESFLGSILWELGLPHHRSVLFQRPDPQNPDMGTSLPFKCSKEEADLIAEGIRNAMDDEFELEYLFTEYCKIYCAEDVTKKGFRQILLSYARDFELSNGYECVT